MKPRQVRRETARTFSEENKWDGSVVGKDDVDAIFTELGELAANLRLAIGKTPISQRDVLFRTQQLFGAIDRCAGIVTGLMATATAYRDLLARHYPDE